jgi:hypothetical protein
MKMLTKIKRNGLPAIKDVAIGGLKVGVGITASLVAGQMGRQLLSASYGGLLGNIVAAGALYVAQKKVKAVNKLDKKNLMAIGAGAAALHSLAMIGIEQGIIPASVAAYIPGATAPVVSANGLSAYVSQAALYGGMGASPIEQAMQHKLSMIEGGMSGGIFDRPTTLGEYDVLESAPAGTNVQSALSAYEASPFGMGATVEQATAGMGATVQEAFAGPGLKEYVSVPLSDYVGVGGGSGTPAYWSKTSPVILNEIRAAAANITARRRAAGLPTGQAFRQNLIAAAQQAASPSDGGVNVARPAAPLTVEAAPFPGSPVADVGATAGQPAALAVGGEYMDDEDSGIFG